MKTQIFPAAQSRTLNFSLVNGRVLKITTLSQIGELVIDDQEDGAAEIIKIIQGIAPALQHQVSISITPATEADIMTAISSNPTRAAELASLIRYLGDAAPEDATPMKVEIVNAAELRPEPPEPRRIDVLQRDADGRLAVALVTDAPIP